MKQKLAALKEQVAQLSALVVNLQAQISELEAAMELPTVTPKVETIEEESSLGHKLLKEFDISYIGVADYITLHYTIFDNGREVPFLNRSRITCDVYGEEGTLLGSKYIHKDRLLKYTELVKRGLYSFDKKTYKPKYISFML